MNKIIKKSRTTYDKMFSTVIVLIGVISCILAESAAIMLMGVFFILMGIVCWFILKSGYTDITTSKTIKKSEVYYPIEYKQCLIEAILHNPEQLKNYPHSPMNTMKIDVFYNDEDVYLQLFEYVPCSYNACTKLIKHKSCDISNLIS